MTANRYISPQRGRLKASSKLPIGQRVAGELSRDYKSVHREVAMLTATGLIERRAADEVAVGWDRAVTELDLAA